MKSLLQNKSTQGWVLAAAAFAAALLWTSFVHDYDQPLLINDSAVEILQTLNMDPWPPRAMIGSYPGGNVDFVESAVLYLNKVLTLVFGESIAVFQWSMRFLFALSVGLMFLFLNRRFSRALSLLGTALFLTSSYAVWPALLLTRNGASVALALTWLLSAENILSKKDSVNSTNRARKFSQWVWFFVISLLVLLSYSSGKIFLFAGFAALLFSLFRQNRRQEIGLLLATGCLTIGVLVLLLAPIPYSVWKFILRGQYVTYAFDQDLNALVRSAWFFFRSVALPVFESPSGFLAEPSHLYFGRPMLNAGLWPFFLLGLWEIWSKRAVVRSCGFFIGVWFFCVLILSYGGPSLKTFYITLPFVFFTVVLGLARVQEWASSRWSWGSQLLVSVSVIYLAVIAAVEVAHMRTYVVARTHGSPEFAGYKMAQWVSTQEYDRLVFHLAGVDLARLALPDFAEKSQFALYSQDFRTHYERDYKGQKVLFVAPDYFWPAVRPHPCGRRTRMTFSTHSFEMEARDTQTCDAAVGK